MTYEPNIRPRLSRMNRSPTGYAWCGLWVMKITARPICRAWITYFRTMPDCRTPRAEVGSSRIRTLAPKYTARAIATAWRSPPDSVPTVWLGSRTSMPILAISSRMIRCAPLMSIRWSGPRPLVGSLPRKKLRHTDISGTVARSWNTVAMPRARASRGPAKITGSPSKSTSPLSGTYTPERILISVDLPAPLSPSTHVTSPGYTATLMSSSALTLPKYLRDRAHLERRGPSGSVHGGGFADVAGTGFAHVRTSFAHRRAFSARR